MIYAAIEINWLSISINVLLIVFTIISFIMGTIIVMQPPKQEGLGVTFGSGVTDQVFGARTTSVLQRATVYFGSLFFILAITLSLLMTKQAKQKSLLEAETPVAEQTTKSAEEAKSSQEEKAAASIVNELPTEAVKTEAAAKEASPSEPITPPQEPAKEAVPSQKTE